MKALKVALPLKKLFITHRLPKKSWNTFTSTIDPTFLALMYFNKSPGLHLHTVSHFRFIAFISTKILAEIGKLTH